MNVNWFHLPRDRTTKSLNVMKLCWKDEGEKCRGDRKGKREGREGGDGEKQGTGMWSEERKHFSLIKTNVLWVRVIMLRGSWAQQESIRAAEAGPDGGRPAGWMLSAASSWEGHTHCIRGHLRRLSKKKDRLLQKAYDTGAIFFNAETIAAFVFSRYIFQRRVTGRDEWLRMPCN